MIWSCVCVIVSMCNRFCTRYRNTNLCEFLVEAVNKACENVACIGDLLGILSNNPDQATSRVGVVQIVNALAQRGNDALIARVAPENILDDNNNLLDNVAHLGVDEFKQHIDSLLSALLNLDRHLANRANCLLHKVHVHFHRVFLKLIKQLVGVGVVGYPDHDLQLGKFEVRWVIVFAEEHAELLVKNSRLLLQ